MTWVRFGEVFLGNEDPPGRPGGGAGAGSCPGGVSKAKGKGYPGTACRGDFCGISDTCIQRTSCFLLRDIRETGNIGDKSQFCGRFPEELGKTPALWGGLFIAGVSPGAEEEWEHCKEKV